MFAGVPDDLVRTDINGHRWTPDGRTNVTKVTWAAHSRHLGHCGDVLSPNSLLEPEPVHGHCSEYTPNLRMAATHASRHARDLTSVCWSRWLMSSLWDLAEPFEHQLLTLGEAAEVLRIGRSLHYQLAHQYLNSGGTSRRPVVRLGEKCLRVPHWALIELATTGRVVRRCDAEASIDGASDAR